MYKPNLKDISVILFFSLFRLETTIISRHIIVVATTATRELSDHVI